MAGTVASKATRDALFLDRYSAVDLPYADIAIAVLVGVAVALYIRASRRLSLRSLQIGSLFFYAANCLTVLVVQRGRQRRGLALHRHLPVGRHLQRARAIAGLDLGQFRAHDARGQAGLRLHRQWRHPRLDRGRLGDAPYGVRSGHRDAAAVGRWRAAGVGRARAPVVAAGRGGRGGRARWSRWAFAPA